MREIKFRAWDAVLNIYGEVIRLEKPDSEIDKAYYRHTGRVSLINLKNDQDCGSWGRWLEKVVLEQFTGLLDKNGKEIYEGDIVKYKIGYKISDPDEIPEDIVDTISTVIYKDGEFSPRCHGFYPDDYWYGYKYYDMEVIGNIHENPELLEGKK